MNAMVKAARAEVSAALCRAGLAADIGGLSDRELLELLRQSPIPVQLVAEVQAAQRERRTQLIATKNRETDALERELPSLQRKEAACAAFVTEKQAELETAKRAHREAHHEMLSRGIRTQYVVNATDAELRVSAPDVIDRRIATWQAEWDQLRNGTAIQVLEIRPHALAGSIARKDLDATAEHSAQIGLRMEGLMIAMREAEQLKLVVLDVEEAVAGLNKIESSMIELAKAARGQ